MRKKIKTDDNQYFGNKEEQAVISYITTNSATEKNKIYNEILIEPFRKMIQSILRKYPIHIGYYDIEEVEENALTHLIEHMIKYKPFIIERKSVNSDKWVKLNDEYRFIDINDANEKLMELELIDNDFYIYRLFKSKAFSYCQTIVRNYYKDHSVRSYFEKTSNLSFDDYFDEVNETKYSEEYDTNEDYLDELIKTIISEIKRIIELEEVKKNEIIVGYAIINILENWEVLFSENTPNGKYNKKVTNKYAKNKILLYLKEQTGLNTKEIRQSIKPFKEIYYLKKMDFYDD